MTKDKTTIAEELNDNLKKGILMTKDEVKHFYKLVEHEYEDILVLMGNPESKNAKRPADYSTVYAWPGTVVGGQAKLFAKEMFDKFSVRAHYLEEIKVKLRVNSLGFRYDVFFAVHDLDAEHFEKRLEGTGIVTLSELDRTFYPARVFSY